MSVSEVESTAALAKTPSQIATEANSNKVQLAYATGVDYLNAEGAMTSDLTGKSFQIVYPGRVFVSVLASTSKDAKVSLSHLVSDVDPTADWSTAAKANSNPTPTSTTTTPSATQSG